MEKILIQKLYLPYEVPFDFAALLWICRMHRVAELEWFEDQSYFRVYEYQGRAGQFELFNDEDHHRLVLHTTATDLNEHAFLTAKVRRMFDLDSDPGEVARALCVDPGLAGLISKHPGVRLYSGWDAFESAIATILGQLVSTVRAQALVGKLVAQFGRESGIGHEGRMIKFFPTPETLAQADFSAIGTTRIRQRTLREFSAAVAEGRISLDLQQELNEFVAQVSLLHGIGPWSAHYMALRALGHADAYPATDLILGRARDFHADHVIESMRPRRGYVAALLWREYAESLTKRGGKKE